MLETIQSFINFHTIYVFTVTSISIGLFFLLSARLDRLRLKRMRSLKKKSMGTIMETETPLDNPQKMQRQIGQESIETRFNFLKKFLPVIIALLWFFIVVTPYLQEVPAIYVSILIGSISVLIGMASKPFVENVVAGLVISFAQPMRIGDVVLLEDKYGVVEDIKLTHSIINMWDWRRLVIPNAHMLAKEIINYSINDHHIWAWVEIHVSASANFQKVEDIAVRVTKESEYFLPVEDPAFWVMHSDRESVRCWVAAWVDSTSAAWEIRCHMRRRIIEEMAKEGIPIHHVFYSSLSNPFPPGTDANPTGPKTANV